MIKIELDAMKSNLILVGHCHWCSPIMRNSEQDLRVHVVGGCRGAPIPLPNIWSWPAHRGISLTKTMDRVLVPKAMQAQNLACLSPDPSTSSPLR